MYRVWYFPRFQPSTKGLGMYFSNDRSFSFYVKSESASSDINKGLLNFLSIPKL